MKNKSTITMLFVEQEKPVQQLLPSLQGLKLKLVEVKKEVLSKSLSELISDINELLESLPILNERAILDQVSIAVQFSAEGGVACIASASAGFSNSMTLTFKVQPPKK